MGSFLRRPRAFRRRRAGEAAREALIRDAALCRDLAAYLRLRRVPEADVEDVLQRVHLGVSRAKGLPAEAAEQRPYVFGIACRCVKTYRRKKSFRPETVNDEEAVNTAMAVESDPVHRELLGKLHLFVPSRSLQTLRWLSRWARGESVESISKKANLPYSQVYERMTTLRRVLVAGVGAIVAIAVFLGVRHFQAKYEEAHRAPKTAPTSAPAHSAQTSTPPKPAPGAANEKEVDPKEQARELRGQAFRACLDDEWETCGRALHKAMVLDMEGDNDKAVQAAWRDSEEGMRHMNDKTTEWQPPKARVYRAP